MLLTYITSSLFSWLFIYSLQIYNAFAEGPQKSCTIISIIIGILTPIGLSLINIFYKPLCGYLLNSIITVLLVGPILFFLLLSFYSLSTSFLISFKKQYRLISAKTSLKKTLLIHSFLVSF